MNAAARVLQMEKPPHSEDFGALYGEHFRAVWRTLQRLGVHPGSVDDATQEVFVTAWRKWDDFEGRSTARTWLLGIAIRVAGDTRRKQRPTEEISVELQLAGPGPESMTASKEVGQRVEQLLSKLDAERREVLLLVDVEGYSVPVVSARPVVVGPAVVAPVVAPAILEPAVVVSEEPAPALTEESSVREIETHFPNCDPGTEMRSALNAKRVLVADRAEEAVWLLGAYQKRCPSGRWSNTAWSVRIAGLCKLGRTAEVINLLDWFSSESLDRRAA